MSMVTLLLLMRVTAESTNGWFIIWTNCQLCYDSSITTKHIIDYLNEHGNDSVQAIDMIHGMTPLHMLSMNPYSPSESIAALLNVNVEVAFHLDNEGKMPLDYAREYNVGGLVAIISGLCYHRHSVRECNQNESID